MTTPITIPAVSMNDIEDISTLSNNECRLLLDCYVDKDRLLKSRPPIYDVILNDTGLNGYIFKIFQLKINNQLSIIIAVRDGRSFYLKRGIVNRFPDDITWDSDDLRCSDGRNISIFESSNPIRYTEFDNKLWIANLVTNGRILITDGTMRNTEIWQPEITMEDSGLLVKNLKPYLIENFTGKIFLVSNDEPYIVYFTMPYDRKIYDDRFIKVGDTKPINDILVQHGKFYVKKDDKIYQVMGLETGLRGNDAACIPVSNIGGYEPVSKLNDTAFFLGNDRKLYTLDRNLADLSTLKMDKFLSKVQTKEMIINPANFGPTGEHNWDSTPAFSFPRMTKTHIEIVEQPTRLRLAYNTDQGATIKMADTFTNPTGDITREIGNNSYGPYYSYFFFRVDANPTTVGLPQHIKSAFRLSRVDINWGAIHSGPGEVWELYHFGYRDLGMVKELIMSRPGWTQDDPPSNGWTDYDPNNPLGGVAVATVPNDGLTDEISFNFPKNANGDYPLVHNNDGFNAGWFVLRRTSVYGLGNPLPMTGFQSTQRLVGNVWYIDPADNQVKEFEIDSSTLVTISFSSVVMELGNKTFEVESPSSVSFPISEVLRIEKGNDPTYYMRGYVTAWYAISGQLIIYITEVHGSGTWNSWGIYRETTKMHMRIRIKHTPFYSTNIAMVQFPVENAGYFTGLMYNCEYPLVYHGGNRKGKISVRISTLNEQGFEQGDVFGGSDYYLTHGSGEIPIYLCASLNGRTIQIQFTFTPEPCNCTTETESPLNSITPFLRSFGIRWVEATGIGIRAYFEPKYLQTTDARYMLCTRNNQNFILRHGLGFSLFKLWKPFDEKVLTDFVMIDKYIVIPYQADISNISASQSQRPSLLYFSEGTPDITNYNCLDFYPMVLSKNIKSYEYASPDKIVFYAQLEHNKLNLFIGAPLDFNYDSLNLSNINNIVRNVKIIEQPKFTPTSDPYLYEHYKDIKIFPFTSYCKNLILRDIQVGIYGKNVHFSALPKIDLYLLSVSDGVLTGKE